MRGGLGVILGFWRGMLWIEGNQEMEGLNELEQEVKDEVTIYEKFQRKNRSVSILFERS